MQNVDTVSHVEHGYLQNAHVGTASFWFMASMPKAHFSKHFFSNKNLN